MTIQKIKTRFRAYRLGSPGSSFSYYYNNYFTLIESRLNDINKPNLDEELKVCNKSNIDSLHITSWDEDHCNYSELKEILNNYNPSKIDKPGYSPHSETGNKCNDLIEEYKTKKSKIGEMITVKKINPDYIKSLDIAKDYGYKEVLFWPKKIDKSSNNNNSTVKLFRNGCFNVLSLGDVENTSIGNSFIGSILKKELDILIRNYSPL